MINKKIYLAFDIDGTIFDAGEILLDAFQDGIKRFINMKGYKDLPVPTLKEIVSVVGIPTEDIFRILFPGLNKNEQNNLNDFCMENLAVMIRNDGGEIFSDVYNVLDLFYNKKYSMLIASNGRAKYVESTLETHDLIKFFSEPFIYPNENLKNKSAVLNYYKENIIDYGTMIMIGDRFTDREAAVENNIPFIGCDFLSGDVSELEGADVIVTEFSEIPLAVENIIKDI